MHPPETIKDKHIWKKITFWWGFWLKLVGYGPHLMIVNLNVIFVTQNNF